MLDHGVHLKYFHGVDEFSKGVIHSQEDYLSTIYRFIMFHQLKTR